MLDGIKRLTEEEKVNKLEDIEKKTNTRNTEEKH